MGQKSLFWRFLKNMIFSQKSDYLNRFLVKYIILYTLLYQFLSYDKNNFHKKLHFCEGGSILKKSNCKVPFRVLRHFTHKASVTSVNADANVHSADWLMSVFVNELTPPHVRSQQGQCVQQCRRIMKDTLHFSLGQLHNTIDVKNLVKSI